MNNILPSYLEYKNYKYIESDGKYYIVIQCFKLPENIEFLEIIEKLKRITMCNISFFIKRLNSLQQTKQLTNKIVNCMSELNTIRNQVDIEFLKKNKEDLESIRRKIQIDGESLYELTLNIMVSDYNLEELYKKVDYIESYFSSIYAIFKRLNYRQDIGFFSCLPFFFNKFNSKINLLSKGVSYLFPFYSTDIIDENGVYIGSNLYNNKMVFLDIFDEKYKNANVSILGASGSGKSYFVKLFIMRNIISNKKQIVFDLEGEYAKIFKKSNATILDFCSSKLNIFDIMHFINLDNCIEIKVSEIAKILSLVNISEKNIKRKIKKAYIDNRIFDNKESLYKMSDNNIKYIKKVPKGFTDMPTIDMLNLDSIPEEIEFLNGITSDNLKQLYDKNNVVIFDFSKVSKSNLELYIDISLIIVENILKVIDSEKIIYFDEVWKIISINKYKYSEIFSDFYKTIRKKKASIITITQDLEDFLSYEGEKYGKKILNNSNFKFIFNINNLDEDLIKNLFGNIEYNIRNIMKGNCLAIIDNNQIMLEIDACKYENMIIKEEIKY